MQSRLTDKFENFSSREKLWAGVALGSVALYFLVQFVIFPVRDQWQGADLALASARTRYLNALSVIRKAEMLDDEHKMSTADSSEITPIVEFIRDIESAAGAAVAIQRFQPTQTAGSSGRIAAKKRGAAAIVTLQVEIDCTGSLPDLLAFFDRVEAAPRLTRIRYYHITPEDRMVDRLHCQLSIFRLLSL